MAGFSHAHDSRGGFARASGNALRLPWYRVGVVAMKKVLPWVAVVLLFAVAAVVFARRSHREMLDFEVYRVAGARAAAAEPLYRAEDGHWQFKYLPAFALAICAAGPGAAGRRARGLVLPVGRAHRAADQPVARMAAGSPQLGGIPGLDHRARDGQVLRARGGPRPEQPAAGGDRPGGRGLLAQPSRRGGRRAARGRHHRQAVRHPLPALPGRTQEVGRGRELRGRAGGRPDPAGRAVRLVRQSRPAARLVERGDHVDRAQPGRAGQRVDRGHVRRVDGRRRRCRMARRRHRGWRW